MIIIIEIKKLLHIYNKLSIFYFILFFFNRKNIKYVNIV